MTINHGNAIDLMKRLLIGSEILARHPSEWYGGQQVAKEAADCIKALVAEVGRLQGTADISQARVEDKVDELSQMRTSLQSAGRVVEAARNLPAYNRTREVTAAIAAHDKAKS